MIHLTSITLQLKLISNNKYDIYLQKSRNKRMHSEHGNRDKLNTLEIAHFNKGNSNFETKINEINILIEKYSPDIFSIVEANLPIKYEYIQKEIPDYSFELNILSDKTKLSRNIILVHKNISYKRRRDLESDITSTIWIEINIPKSKPALFMGGYRQWRLPKVLNVNKSNSTKSQLERYDLILKNWQKASLEKKDVIILMDDNIDTVKNNCHNNKYKINKLLENLQNHLNDNNFILHNKKCTHFAPHQSPSCIDH